MSDPHSSRIVRLTVQNLLRVRAAEITPDGALVIVAGANDQGKSSLLNSIVIALSGKDLPVEPIRSGAANGHVILETDELVVTRRFSRSGGSTLEVRDKGGGKIMSPQAKLDTLVSRVTFDPFEFTRMDPKHQLETVRKIAGVDFTELDAEYREKFDARTALGRRVREQEAKLTSIHRVPDAPAEEVSVSYLLDKLAHATDNNQIIAKERYDLSELNDQVDSLEERISQLTAALAKAQKDLAQTQAERDALKASVAEKVEIDMEPLHKEIRDSEFINAGVRMNQQWTTEHRALLALQNQVADITNRLEVIAQKKTMTLEKATFPVPGLGFNDNGVTFNGVPFEQAGSAVKIRTSVAIARSLNPKLPVMLVRDGSLLDQGNMELLRKEAEEHGCQIWIEVVGTREDATVVIEDGEVIDTPAKKKKAKSTAVA